MKAQSSLFLTVLISRSGAPGLPGYGARSKACKKPSFVEDTRFLSLAYNNLGEVLLHVGEWKRAEAAVLTAIQYVRRNTLKRDETDALLTLGELQLYQGKIDQAEVTVERALRLRADVCRGGLHAKPAPWVIATYTI